MNYTRIFIRRRFGLLLLAVFIFLSSPRIFAMENAEGITIPLAKVTLAEAIKKIEAASDYTFFYDAIKTNLRQQVTLKADNQKIEDVLNVLLKTTDLQYKITDHQIALIPRDNFKSTQSKKKITGVVVDETGIPVIGANVVEAGTTNGTITDLEGKFSLDVPLNADLLLTYVGYVSANLKVGSADHYNVQLALDSQGLDEVIVVGYGTVKKKDLTGAVASLQGDLLSSRKTTQLSAALQGAVAGVLVTRDNSAPGATAGSIKIRGVTTIGDSSPLVIVDGVPGDINQVNPNDVENMSVLKDAASASIYGSRAAAGVILITTKRASENDLTLGYNFEYGWEIPTKQPEYVGIQRFLEMTNELRYNDNNAGGMYQTYSQDQVENWVKYNATDPNNYPITDWTDLILKSSAPRQTHSLNIAGGSKSVRTKASVTYDKTDGLYADRYYERFMTRVNNDFKINNYLGATLDFNFKRSKSHQPVFDPINRMRIAAPVYAAVWDDGRMAEGKSGSNPYAIMENGGSKDSWYNQIGGKASIDFTPIEGLKISGIVAPIYNFDKIKSFSLAAAYTLANDPNTIGGYYEGHSTTKLNEDRNDSYNVTTQFIATYLKTLGKHDLNVMLGYENYFQYNETLFASRDQYELTNYPYLDLGPLSLRDNGGSAYETAYRSMFGRIMYSYANKYLLQANIRYDGSSRFHKDYRWGSFPSFSAGWVVSEESFMKDADLNWLSFAKLRASWGTLGNERIGNYPYQATIAFSNALFYQNGIAVSELTAAQQQYAIQNISWETTESLDLGMDLSFLDNRLRFTGDYYHKTTKDMLLALEIPDYVGFDNPDKNTGKMSTNGYELEVGWNDKAGDFSYSVSVNFSDFLSEMGDLGGTQFIGDQVKMKGSQFNEWYGYISEGLFQSQEDLNNSAKINNNVKVGDVKYKDISGPDGVPDGKISSEYDRVLLGGSLPRYMFGGNVSAKYKGFDFSMAFQGVGSQLVRLNSMMIEPLSENWGNIPSILDGNYWSSLKSEAENAKARYPRLTRSNISSNQAMSDFWLFNGRYVRLKNLTLGYTLPLSLTNKVSIDKIRIYASANDLFCLSKFPKGWDPEMGSSSYPITTSLLLGVSVNF